MLDNTKTLADLLNNEAGARLYRHESGYATSNAQQNLQGRTPYAEDDQLRWHKARILSSRHHLEGCIFVLIESVSLDWDNTRRGFRFVVFDVFGTVIERADLENTFKTSDKARAAFWAWLGTFDPFTYYADTLTNRAARMQREVFRLTATAAAIKTPAQEAAPCN